MELPKHWKLYKSGKKWCVMALSTALAVTGLAVTTAHAAQNDNTLSTSIGQLHNTEGSLNTKPSVQDNSNPGNVNGGPDQSAQGHQVNVQESQFVNQEGSQTSQTNPAKDEAQSNVTVNSNQLNGWKKNDSGQDVYYQNGNVTAGRNYVELPTIPNTNVNDNQSWYLMENGVALSGAQQWQGSMYYFDPVTHLRVDNNYVVPAGQKVGYLLGDDGRALTGVQKWQGTYYYFDPATYKLLDHQAYVQSQWGLWYMVGNNGALMTGLVSWQGSHYYFDPYTYLRVDNNYVVPEGQNGGYLLGNDGKALSGVQKWQGTYYYFDPSTYKLLDHQAYVQSQWGLSYMVGSNGAVMSGLVNWQGSLYYFDPVTYLRVDNQDITINGDVYHFDGQGRGTKIRTSVDGKVDRALSMIGTPYVWGGNTPGGFDCSGLVQWAYGLGSGYRTTYQQTNLGAHRYDVMNAPKGALLFFGSDGAPYHVAISLGNGSYVHAPTIGQSVTVGYSQYFTPSYYIVMG